MVLNYLKFLFVLLNGFFKAPLFLFQIQKGLLDLNQSSNSRATILSISSLALKVLANDALDLIQMLLLFMFEKLILIDVSFQAVQQSILSARSTRIEAILRA